MYCVLVMVVVVMVMVVMVMVMFVVFCVRFYVRQCRGVGGVLKGRVCTRGVCALSGRV